MSDDALITSLTAALDARPDDLTLRLHVAGVLTDLGHAAEAVAHVAQILARDPANQAAQQLMRRALTATTPSAEGPAEEATPGAALAPGAPTTSHTPGAPGAALAPGAPTTGPAPAAPTAPATGLTPGPAAEADRPAADGPAATDPAGDRPDEPVVPDAGRAAGTADGSGPAAEGDPLAQYEQELSGVVPPRYAPAEDRQPAANPMGDRPEPVRGDSDRQFDVETSKVRLADVGGMEAVKERLELSFLGPLRDPELRRLYGKSLRGGLMLYGPPGCGKTFLARAVAGEMGARFMSLSIVDVLDMWIGKSERNLHELFETARRNAPCVLFLDEVDALGQKRSQTHSSSMRTVGNQLLAELDGIDGDNEGVFVLAATNTPWQVDPALRRPGRLDRMVLVLPPDAAARATIIQLNLRDRPIAGIDLPRIVAATEDFSGADLSHLCETAAEYAMADSMRSGRVRMIGQPDFDRALREVRSSTGPWFATARNVAMFSNEGGAYDDLVAYLKARKLLR